MHMQKSYMWVMSFGFLILGTLSFQYSISSTKEIYKIQKTDHTFEEEKELTHLENEKNTEDNNKIPLRILSKQEEKIRQQEIHKIEKGLLRFEKKQKEKIRKIQRQLSRAELKLKSYQMKIDNLTKQLNSEKEKLTKETKQQYLKLEEDQKVLKK